MRLLEVGLAFGLTGCVLPSLALPVDRSGYHSVDVGYVRLTTTTGAAQKVCGVSGFVDEHPDELMTRQAIRAALDAVPEAEALVDLSISSHVSNYGLFAMCWVEVRGTAVRSRQPSDDAESPATGVAGVGL